MTASQRQQYVQLQKAVDTRSYGDSQCLYAVIFDDPEAGPGVYFVASRYQAEAERIAMLHRAVWPDSYARVQNWS